MIIYKKEYDIRLVASLGISHFEVSYNLYEFLCAIFGISLFQSSNVWV